MNIFKMCVHSCCSSSRAPTLSQVFVRSTNAYHQGQVGSSISRLGADMSGQSGATAPFD